MFGLPKKKIFPKGIKALVGQPPTLAGRILPPPSHRTPTGKFIPLEVRGTAKKPSPQSVGFGKGQTRPKVTIDKETHSVLSARAKVEAQLKDVEAKLRDPKHAGYKTELMARRDMLHRKLNQ